MNNFIASTYRVCMVHLSLNLLTQSTFVFFYLESFLSATEQWQREVKKKKHFWRKNGTHMTKFFAFRCSLFFFSFTRLVIIDGWHYYFQRRKWKCGKLGSRADDTRAHTEHILSQMHSRTYLLEVLHLCNNDNWYCVMMTTPQVSICWM